MRNKSNGDIVEAVRGAMKNKSFVNQTVHAFIIPTDDAHMSEYVADFAKRREYVSNFTGSAGTAVVTSNRAALWTDGRYWLQAGKELDSKWELVKDRLPDTPTIGNWLSDGFKKPSIVAADPHLHTSDDWSSLEADLSRFGHSLVPVSENLVDKIWEGQPDLPKSEAFVWEEQYAGLKWIDKVRDVRESMAKKSIDLLVVTPLDEIAWLLNLRGSDIPYNPVFYSYVMLTQNEIYLFVDREKLGKEVRNHLFLDDKYKSVSMEESNEVQVKAYDELLGCLEKILLKNTNYQVGLSRSTNQAIVSVIPAQNREFEARSIISLQKALKNKTEIAGMRKCQIRDSIALAEFFHWLEKSVGKKTTVTELDAANKLEQLRSEQKNYVSLSFDTISSAGPNAAVIHYKPTEESARVVLPDDVFLLDSGSQYLDGTTDITRTIHLGTPSADQKNAFTRVLKGHIQFAMLKFPAKTTGHRLDAIARKPLWDAGLDFQHGLGHGMGCFLNVHEGPQSVSFRYSSSDPGLEASMIVTDEPGYYEDGKWGIRIESDLLVVGVGKGAAGQEFLAFENLTLVPIQTKMIDAAMLSKEEVNWLNMYHEKCRDVVGPILKAEERHGAESWLVRETQPIG